MLPGPVCLCKEVSFTYPQLAAFFRQVIYSFEHKDLGLTTLKVARKSTGTLVYLVPVMSRE